MKEFAKKIAGFISVGLVAFAVLLSIYICLDPFKVLYKYDDYYTHNVVTPNRGLITLGLFEKNEARFQYNSFIFGNSRSQAFKVPEWEKHLDPGANGFHFDASGEGIYGIYNKINFIQKNKVPIKNALIVLDYEALTETKNRMGFIFISPPELSGESKLAFHEQFLKAYFDPIFLVGYSDYKIFHVYRDYMDFLFTRSKYDFSSDKITGDLYYWNDRMIKEDKDGYYNNLVKKGVFFDRSTRPKRIEDPISPDEITLLEKIHASLVTDNTKYSIVISPTYDQEKLSAKRMELLNTVFGSKNVFDFSGKNNFTESIYNYYEYLHYRPLVANEIMDSIYKQKQDMPGMATAAQR